MSDSAKWHRFDMEKIGDFLDRNLIELGFDVTMDPETLKDIVAAAGWRVEMDAQGWHIVRHRAECVAGGRCHADCRRLVRATLPLRDCLNDKGLREEHPLVQGVDPARRPFFSMFRPKNGAWKSPT